MSQIILINELHFPEIPEHLINQVFGSEVVVSNTGRVLAKGESVCLNGDPEEIANWIKLAGGEVWTSNNPMVGRWVLKGF